MFSCCHNLPWQLGSIYTTCEVERNKDILCNLLFRDRIEQARGVTEAVVVLTFCESFDLAWHSRGECG